MTDNTHTPSLTQTSDEDNSTDHSPGSFATLSGGGSIVARAPPATTGYYIIQEENMNDQPQQVLDTPSKRPRGRPPGSKNKPKPPIVIRQESDEDALKPVVIEIPTRNDVIEALVTFARRHRVNISVLSGSGSVTDISLRHHVSCASIFPIHGTFRILSLTRTYFGVRFPSLLVLPLELSSQGLRNKCLVGLLMATVFKNPEFHTLSFITGNIVDEENNNVYAGLINADHSGGANIVPSGNTNNAIVMMPNMSAFGVTASAGQLNGQVPIANLNVLQQNHLSRLP